MPLLTRHSVHLRARGFDLRRVRVIATAAAIIIPISNANSPVIIIGNPGIATIPPVTIAHSPRAEKITLTKIITIITMSNLLFMILSFSSRSRQVN